jgi:FkbM family methyltransferase
MPAIPPALATAYATVLRKVRAERWRMLHRGARRLVTVRAFNGRITFDSRDTVIGRELFVTRQWERAVMRDVAALLRAEGLARLDGTGTFFDVGANIGVTCLAALREGWCARAVAFEPAPANVALLERNVAQNGYADRVVRRPWALSDADGTLELELSPANFGDHRIRHVGAAPAGAAPAGAAGGRDAFAEDARPLVRVPVRTLDGVLRDDAELRGARPEVLWVDIQGHEGQFFRGAAATLAAGVPVFSEVYPYAIRRSGLTRDAYLAVVEEAFTHVWLRREPGPGAAGAAPAGGDPGAWRRATVGAVADVFDRLTDPLAQTEVVFARA